MLESGSFRFSSCHRRHQTIHHGIVISCNVQEVIGQKALVPVCAGIRFLLVLTFSSDIVTSVRNFSLVLAVHTDQAVSGHPTPDLWLNPVHTGSHCFMRIVKSVT